MTTQETATANDVCGDSAARGVRSTGALGPVLRAAALAGFAALAAAAGGCHSPRTSPATNAVAGRLTGAWDVRFRAAAHRSSDSVTTANGELAFVRTHTLSHVSDLDAPTNVGSYDIDFTPLGFDVSDPTHPPVAVADASGADSVHLMLDPGGPRPVVWMHGRWRGDSLVGRWRVDLGRAAERGGTFTLTRHGVP